MTGQAVHRGSVAHLGVPAGHGNGSNLSNSPPPDLPTEERTTDVEAWRAGIEAKRRLGPAARAAVVAAYVAGEPTTAIAARHRITSTTVTNWAKAAGVPLRGRPGTTTPSHPSPSDPPVLAGRRRVVVAAYEAGASIADLAAEHQMDKRTIRRLLTSAGVTIRRQGRRPAAAVVPPAAEAVGLEALVEANPPIGGGTPPTVEAIAAAVTEAGPGPSFPEVLGEEVRVVARALADVVEATERLVDAQRMAATYRVRHLQTLAAALLAALDQPTDPTTTSPTSTSTSTSTTGV